MSRRTNSFDDETNDWLREHADDLKGIEDAPHLKPNSIEPLEDATVAADPPCAACGRPIFEEFVDLKQLEYCTRPKCQKKRRKLEREQAKAAAELANPPAAKPAKTKRVRPAPVEHEDDNDDYDLEGQEFHDAVDDMNELAHKFFVEDPAEQDQLDRDRRKESAEDLRTGSYDSDEEDFDETLGLDEDEDGLSEESADEPEGDEEDTVDSQEDEVEEKPEGTSTRKTKVKVKRKLPKKIRADGEGIVPIAGDLDDDLPLLARIRKGYRPPPRPDRSKLVLGGSEFFTTKRCEAHGIDACVQCFPPIAATRAFEKQQEKLRKMKEQQEAEEYALAVARGDIIPPPKNESEAFEQEAARVLKKRLKKEEMERRKIVRKRRPRVKPKETPNQRARYKFTTRQLADVMDNALFNKPFPVLDRSRLYDPTSIFHKWYEELKKNAEQRGISILDARRRGDARYEDYTRWKTEFEIVDGKPTVVTVGYVMPEIMMIDGVAISVDPVDAEALAPSPPKTVKEVLPDGSTKSHVVKLLAIPKKINRRVGVRTPHLKSPSTYGELINALPYRQETMLTIEERNFYKDHAARNLTRMELEKKHGEKTVDDILLLENRAIKWAFKLRLLEPPLDEFEPDFERLLDEDIALDIRMISKTGGGYIGGRVTGGKLNRYGRTMQLNSFRTRPIQEGRGWESKEDNGKADYDDYGDESAA